MASTAFIFFSITSMLMAISFTKSVFSFPTEKETHLHFFIQERLNPPNNTVIRVAPSPLVPAGSSALNFGTILILDDFLTVGPDPGSRLLGRAQGLSAVASVSGSELLFILNLVFTEPGPHNGSSLSVLSRNPIKEAVRELPVVGGTGQFRMARGYALLKTYYLNNTSGRVSLEVDVFVFHY